MVSKEFIFSTLRSGHVIAVHMKENERIDSLSSLIYVIYELVLDDSEEKQLLYNVLNNISTHGILKVKAKKTSEVEVCMFDEELHEYVIDTKDIVKYE